MENREKHLEDFLDEKITLLELKELDNELYFEMTEGMTDEELKLEDYEGFMERKIDAANF